MFKNYYVSSLVWESDVKIHSYGLGSPSINVDCYATSLRCSYLTSWSILLKITLAEVTEGGWIRFYLDLGSVLE